MNLKSLVIYADSARDEGRWFEGLGFVVRNVSDDYIVASLGTVDLEVHTAASESIEEFVSEAAIEPRFAGIYLYVRVPDAKLLFNEIGDSSEYAEPIDRPWGNLEFLARSPSGLKIVFYSRA